MFPKHRYCSQKRHQANRIWLIFGAYQEISGKICENVYKTKQYAPFCISLSENIIK